MNVLAVLLCTALFASTSIGQHEEFGDEDILPPIMIGVDHHGHMVPSLPENDTAKPLIGRPDGHEPTTGDKQTEKPLIGRPDGHEPTAEDKQTAKPLIGRPDGHEPTAEDKQTAKPLIGRPDGHELGQLLGRPDGHERLDEELIGQHDGHDSTGEEVPPEAGVDDEDEPLVRCKRPLCSCNSFEFQTDANGCLVCKCLEHPCQNVECGDGKFCRQVECEDAQSCSGPSAECVSENLDCPQPMCANYCPDGYAHNKAGCMTCTCNSKSVPEEVQDDHSACPMVMCANFCPSGYKRNERGCTTCDCVDETLEGPSCGEEKCDVGQICRMKPEPCCTPKPLCFLAQEMAYMKRDGPRPMKDPMRMFVPTCEDSGAFKPMQCYGLVSECWCVDDRGKEIDGTRAPMTPGDDTELHCEPNVTLAVHMHITLTSSESNYDYENKDDEDDGDEEENKDDDDDDDDDDDFLLNLNKSHRVLQDSFSSWLLVEKQYISVIKVEQDSKSQVSVLLLVSSGGPVDLPSAVEHMKRKIRMGHCDVPLENMPKKKKVPTATLR